MDLKEEQIAFYSELGRAITQWAHVEFALSWIVGRCFDQKDANNAAFGLLSIENIRAKLQYAESIVSNRGLSKTEKTKWAELTKRIGQLAKKRNRLAHSWVLNDPTAAPGRRIMLLPTRLTKTQSRQKHPGAVCLRDVAGYRLEFFALMTALENFSDRLAGQEEQFPKYQEQPQRPPTIAQIRRQIYAFASRPPRPSPT